MSYLKAKHGFAADSTVPTPCTTSSRITLTFRNATQFDTLEPSTFRVEIRRGRVIEVIPVDTPQI
jgi:hypothetical protein